MKRPDVDRMLHQISYRKFQEWKVYDTLEPFGEEQAALRVASIVQAMWNIHARDPKTNPRGWPLFQFLTDGYEDLRSWMAAAHAPKATESIWRSNKDKLFKIAYAWAGKKYEPNEVVK